MKDGCGVRADLRSIVLRLPSGRSRRERRLGGMEKRTEWLGAVAPYPASPRLSKGREGDEGRKKVAGREAIAITPCYSGSSEDRGGEDSRGRGRGPAMRKRGGS